MANYTASALAAAQVAYSENFQQPEVRRQQNPALMMGLKNQQVTVINHQELRTKADRPVKAYIRTRKTAGASVTKSHGHTGTKADSKEVTLVWVQFVETFSINLKQAQNNIFSYQTMLTHEIMEAARNLQDRAGNSALTFLQANRDQRTAANVVTGGNGTWNQVNFALEIANGNKDKFYQNTSSFMRAQNYRGRYDVIADQAAYRQAQWLVNQGSSNQNTLSFQMQDFNIAETTRVIDANYNTNGSILVMPEGAFAALGWNDPVNLKGKGDYDSYNGGYGTILDPLGSGQLYDFHAYTQRVDGSATGGGVQDESLECEMTYNVAWVLPPLSTASESVVYEIAQM